MSVGDVLEALRQVARAAAPLRIPALVGVGVFLLAVAAIVLSARGERYLIPSLVGLLWSLSTYAFVTTFRFVPRAGVPGESILSRLKRRLKRGWYALLALVCAASTVAALVVGYRLLTIWLREYRV